MLPEVISGSIGILDTIALICRLCPKTNFYTREVESIDFTNRTVTMSSGVRPRPSQLAYDHLVVAVGNVTNLVGQPGLAEHALPFKYLGDALMLRNRVTNRAPSCGVPCPPLWLPAEDSLASKLSRNSMTSYGPEPVIFGTSKRPKFVSPFYTRARSFSPNCPRTWPGSRLAGATAEFAILDGGDRIPTKTLVSTVPAAPNAFGSRAALQERTWSNRRQ